MTNKTCNTCYNGFNPAKKKQIYCSVDCQRKGLIKRSVSNCQNNDCNKSFEHKFSDNRKYCSRSCAAQMNNRSSPKRKPEGTCLICHNRCSTSNKYCSECATFLSDVSAQPIQKTCKWLPCSNAFKTLYETKLYCSKKCRASYNVKFENKDKTRSETCPGCKGAKTKRSANCFQCAVEKKTSNKIESWLSGEWNGASGQYLSTTIRRYLLEQAGFSCEKCGFDTPHPSDGSSILEVDHIDGDGENHSPENLRVLCPNCHALTPTYRARNMGKGRKQYYVRMNASFVDQRLSDRVLRNK